MGINIKWVSFRPKTSAFCVFNYSAFWLNLNLYFQYYVKIYISTDQIGYINSNPEPRPQNDTISENTQFRDTHDSEFSKFTHTKTVIFQNVDKEIVYFTIMSNLTIPKGQT